MPAYNEERRLPESLSKILHYLQGQDYTWEVIVVDDGSEDGTAGIVEEFQARWPNLRLIRNPHAGKAYSVRTGVLAAEGQFVFHCDVDLSVPITELHRFVAPLEQGFDVAIGSRVIRHGFPWYRWLMSWGFTLIRSLVVRGFRDTQCGFKCYRRQAAQDLFRRARLYSQPTGQLKGALVTAFDVEILFLAVKRGYRVAEVPVEWHYSPRSKVNPIRDSLQNLRDVLQVLWNDWRGLYD